MRAFRCTWVRLPPVTSDAGESLADHKLVWRPLEGEKPAAKIRGMKARRPVSKNQLLQRYHKQVSVSNLSERAFALVFFALCAHYPACRFYNRIDTVLRMAVSVKHTGIMVGMLSVFLTMSHLLRILNPPPTGYSINARG